MDGIDTLMNRIERRPVDIITFLQGPLKIALTSRPTIPGILIQPNFTPPALLAIAKVISGKADDTLIATSDLDRLAMARQ